MSNQIEIFYNNGVYVPTPQNSEDKNVSVYCGGCSFYNTNQCFKVECNGLDSDVVYKLDVKLTRREKLKRLFKK